MSVIDSRVVQLLFDNTQFQSGIKESLGSLTGFGKQLESFNNGESLAAIANAVTSIADKFTFMGRIGLKVMDDLATSALNTGKRILKSVSIDQISAGWTKYAEKTTSVQTIMAATTQSWVDDAAKLALTEGEAITTSYELSSSIWDLGQSMASGSTDSKTFAKELKNLGVSEEEFSSIYDQLLAKTNGGTGSLGEALTNDVSQIDYVDKQLAKLNLFSDETSYTFTDMVSNIGKFTGAGQSLSTSVDAMQGIANWAAISGQNASTASRAMYNISQAMGTGAMKAIDWKSIENANMATQEFKQTALQAAVAEGKLQIAADGSVNQLNEQGKVVKKLAGSEEEFVNGFRDTLQAGWFDTDVMSSVFSKYGEFSGKIMEVSQASKISVTDLIQMTDAVVEAGREGDDAAKAFDEMANDMGLTEEQYDSIKESIFELSKEEYDLGRKSLKAAQEAKTFNDALDATRDAVSTAFMNIFEGFFGNYEKAKTLWTGFANFLYELIVVPLENIQEIMDSFTAVGGPEAVAAMFDALGSAILLIRDAIVGVWEEIFPPKSAEENGERLAATIGDITTKIENFISTVQETSGFKAFINIIKGIFAIFDILRLAVKAVVDVFKEDLLPIIQDVFGSVGDGASSFSDWIQNIRETITQNDTFYRVLKKIVEFIKPALETVIDIIGKVIDAVKNLFSKFSGNEGGDGSAIINFIDGLSNVFSTASNIISKAGDLIKGAWDKVKSIFESIKEYLSTIDLKTAFSDAIDLGITTGLGVGGIKLVTAIGKFFEDGGFSSITEKLGGIADAVTGVLDKIGGAIQGFTNSQNAGAVKDVAISLLIMAAALLVFSIAVNNMDALDMVTTLSIMVAVVSLLLGTFLALIEISKKMEGSKVSIALVATSLVSIALALLILGVALALFSKVAEMEGVWKGLGLMAASLGILVVAVLALNKISAKVIFAAAAIMILSVALIILAGAIALFTLVSQMDNVWVGLGLMASTLAVVVIALMILGKMALRAAIASVALTVTAVALLLLAGAMAAFVKIAEMKNAWEGFGLMAAVLGTVVVLLMVLGSMALRAIAASIAITIMSVALLILAGAMFAFALIMEKMPGATAGIIAIVVLLGAIVLALIMLGTAAPLAIVGAAAILIVAVALVVLAAAVVVAAIGLNLLVLAFSGILDAIISFGVGIGEVVSSIGSGIGNAISSIGEGLSNAISLIATAISTAIEDLLTTITNGLSNSIDVIGKSISGAVEKIIASIGNGIGEGLTSIGDGITELGKGVSDVGTGITDFGNGVRSLEGIKWVDTAVGVKEMAGALKQLGKAEFDSEAVENMQAYASAYTQIASAAAAIPSIVANATASLNQGLASMSGTLTSGMSALTSSIQSSLSKVSLYKQGQNIVQGLVNGIRSKIEYAKQAMKDVASAMTGWFCIQMGINSPSKLFYQYGDYIDQGLAEGISDNTKPIMNSMAALSAGIATAMESDYSQPVIRPTLDLSNVRVGAATINSMFNNPSLKLNGSYEGNESSANSEGSSNQNAGNTINIYPQQLTEATMEYIYHRFNSKMGVIV